MDLETENRLAALLMEEARRLRAEADKEGVHAYLRLPNVRGRPNSRFLTATVLGVEQANRAVEVNEMWRAREKERELDAKLKSRAKEKDVRYCENRDDSHKKVRRHEEEACRRFTFASTSKHGCDEDICYSSEDGCLKDDEVEEFLRSRAKRGRGTIGSRMDEPGPYPSAISLNQNGGKLLAEPDMREKEEWERRILGPEKPSFIKSHELPPEAVRDKGSSKKKHHSKDKKKKKRPKEERSDRRRKTEEKKKSKHRHHKNRRSKGDSE